LDEEALIIWQDVLDEIHAGRKDNLTCPHCGHMPLEVTQRELVTRIACPQCKQYLEGSFGMQ